MEFTDVSVKCNGTAVAVRSVSGNVEAGEILAVCSHSAVVNSAVLSTFAGRGHSDTGHIKVKGEGFKGVRLVDKHDYYLPTLSILETVQYAADLRVGKDVSRKNHREEVRKTLQLLGLYDVRKTQVLAALPKYKKLLGIACEIVYRTGVLIIDDPTAGLTLTDAQELIKTLVDVASRQQTTVIISSAYPNSCWLSLCHKVMFLANQEIVYNGSTASLSDFLVTAGCPCPKSMSPSDYIMTVLHEKGGEEERCRNKLTELSKSLCNTTVTEENVWLKNCDQDPEENEVTHSSKYHIKYNNRNGYSEETTLSVEAEDSLLSKHVQEHVTYSVSFWHQLRVLTARNFHNARRRILFPVSIIQNMYILVLCVLVWWRPERTEQSIADRMGLFFFTTVQWAFFSLLDAILTFPKELKVYKKERESKLYHVTALCIAKSVSELPLALIQPFVYMSVIYWVANLNGVGAFFWSLLVLSFDVYAAQSVGLFVGVALNPPWTISVVSLGLLSMMLWGGAFNKLPSFLRWGPYASFFTYGLRAFIVLEFQDGPPIRCANKSMIPICNTEDPLTNATVTHFPSKLVLVAQGLTWSVWYYIMVLGAIIVMMRCLWCFLVRLK